MDFAEVLKNLGFSEAENRGAADSAHFVYLEKSSLNHQKNHAAEDLAQLFTVNELVYRMTADNHLIVDSLELDLDHSNLAVRLGEILKREFPQIGAVDIEPGRNGGLWVSAEFIKDVAK